MHQIYIFCDFYTNNLYVVYTLLESSRASSGETEEAKAAENILLVSHVPETFSNTCWSGVQKPLLCALTPSIILIVSLVVLSVFSLL